MAAGFGNFRADQFDVHRQASGLAAVQLQFTAVKRRICGGAIRALPATVG